MRTRPHPRLGAMSVRVSSSLPGAFGSLKTSIPWAAVDWRIRAPPFPSSRPDCGGSRCKRHRNPDLLCSRGTREILLGLENFAMNKWLYDGPFGGVCHRLRPKRPKGSMPQAGCLSLRQPPGPSRRTLGCRRSGRAKEWKEIENRVCEDPQRVFEPDSGIRSFIRQLLIRPVLRPGECATASGCCTCPPLRRPLPGRCRPAAPPGSWHRRTPAS